MYVCGVFFNLHAMSMATCVRMFRVLDAWGDLGVTGYEWTYSYTVE